MTVLILLAAGLVYLTYLVRPVLVPFALGTVLAFILEPVVRWLEGRGLSRLMSILLVYLALGSLIAGFLVYFIPVLVRQLTLLAASLPSLTAQVQVFIADLQSRYSSAGLPAEVRGVLENAIGQVETRLLSFIQGLLAGLFGALSGLINLVLAPFLAFYLLKDRELIRERVMGLFPTSSRGETARVVAEMNRTLAGFIRGQLLVSLIVGTLLGLATSLLGLRFSAVLGVIGGAFNIIPYFGPLIGAVPAVILAGLESPLLALKTAGAYAAIQQIDSLFITPRVVGGSVGLHPLVVIFSLLAGAQLFGLAGMLLAIPVVAVGRVLVAFLYHKLVTDWAPAGKS